MKFDVVVAGGGTAGCVLAARLSEDPSRHVCLVEAGPDYGPLSAGGWPAEMLDARSMPFTHDWGTGGEDSRSLGAKILGGCSAHNACVMVRGSPEDYDEWGGEWRYERFSPYLDRAAAELRTTHGNTDYPSPFHAALVSSAVAAGLELLSDPSDPEQPVGVAQYPANVVDGTRWNAALAYLDPARQRPNLTVHGGTLVDRVLFDGTRAVGVVASDGRSFEAATVILAAGAYFSPAILLRSGVGAEGDLRPLDIPVVSVLPVGRRLLDHCGTGLAWIPSERLQAEITQHEREHGLFESHVLVKAASSSCPPGSWDIHLLSWISRTSEPGRFEVSCGVFHVKPLSVGRVRVGSRDPTVPPVVERGFLAREEDLGPIVEGIALGRALARTEPLLNLLAGEARPGQVEPEQYVRDTIRNYFHPAGTCAIGEVVDANGRVLGLDGLLVADASIMPTIPRANTNLTTAAIAERIAATLQ